MIPVIKISFQIVVKLLFQNNIMFQYQNVKRFFLAIHFVNFKPQRFLETAEVLLQ